MEKLRNWRLKEDEECGNVRHPRCKGVTVQLRKLDVFVLELKQAVLLWYAQVLSWAIATEELVQEDWDTLWRVACLLFLGLQFLHSFLRRCQRRFRSTATSSRTLVRESACCRNSRGVDCRHSWRVVSWKPHARSGMLSNISHARQAIINFQVPRVQMSQQVAFLCHLCPVLPPVRGQGCFGRLPTNGPHKG